MGQTQDPNEERGPIFMEANHKATLTTDGSDNPQERARPSPPKIADVATSLVSLAPDPTISLRLTTSPNKMTHKSPKKLWPNPLGLKTAVEEEKSQSPSPKPFLN